MATEAIVVSKEMASQVRVMSPETVARFVTEERVSLTLGQKAVGRPWPLEVFERSYMIRDRRPGETAAEFGYRRETLTGG